MQPQPIVLEEIIYEITGRCKNRCNYCGSSDIWDMPIDEDKIKKIIDAIAEYPPKVINVSGGDPLEVSPKIHEYLEDRLRDVVRHVIINPRSIARIGVEKVNHALECYNWIGISINTYDELEAARDILSKKTNVTVITNFNLLNIFLFESIKKLILETNDVAIWQIQYTMFFNDDDERAMYRDAHSVGFLRKSIVGAMQEGMNIVMADNMNNGPCGAGIRSVGILEDGSVIPCLSMRSWCKVNQDIIQGNLFEESLEVIWQDKFQDYRFKDFKCCKDVCKACITISNEEIIKPEAEKSIDELGKDLLDKFRDPLQQYPRITRPNVTVYSVVQPGSMMYAVTQPGTLVYGVTTNAAIYNEDIDDNKNKT